MKITILLLATFFFCSVLTAQNAAIKFILRDATSKSFQIDSINNMLISKSQSGYTLKVYFQKSKCDSLATSNIDSIKFESVLTLNSDIVIYNHLSATKRYTLSSIDSMIVMPVSGPNITNITPSSAKLGDEVTINGSGFGAKQNISYVSFAGNDAVVYTSWNDTKIVLNVPDGTSSGKVSVTVNGTKSNEVNFSLIPVIDFIDMNSGVVGDVITISGTGFGSVRDSSKVDFGSMSATEYPSWSSSEIRAIVPAGATTGKLSVTVAGIKSNGMVFTVKISPVITSINPTSFAVGDAVTINGTDFGSSKGSSVLYFGSSIALTFTSWTNTKIVCKVPDGAGTGKLSVSVDGTKSNAIDFKITSSLPMVLVPAGTFQMGNAGAYSGTIYISELPVHQVRISKRFYMGKFEVTQALYTAVVGTNQSTNKGNDLPVERINWYDAVGFCNKLSDKDGYTKCYTINGTSVTCNWSANGYRLPTEAEWEYACKATTATDFYSGNNESDLSKIGWYSANSGEVSHLPGQKTPNIFGLYDIIGNVFEWVWDWSGTYSGASVTDPTGPSSGTIKITRGGSFHNSVTTGMCRSSARGWMDTPSLYSSTVGIRVVRTE